MSDNVYGFMSKWRTVDLGQVFTPLHMARFAAKLLDIKEGDSVLDSSAGSGALLLAAAERGASKIYGIEYDGEVFRMLQNNLDATDTEHEVLNADSKSEEAAEWIKEKRITKAILNPPYEKKFGSLDIFINTLKALPDGTQIAVFYPTSQLDKMTKKQSEWFKNNCNVQKKITMPTALFSPFVSVQTALFIITKGEPQGDIFFCTIEDDGLTRQKGKYRIDKYGKWANELEPYWFKVIKDQEGDESCHIQEGSKGYSYQPPLEPVTEEGFKKVVRDYLAWKVSEVLKGHTV